MSPLLTARGLLTSTACWPVESVHRGWGVWGWRIWRGSMFDASGRYPYGVPAFFEFYCWRLAVLFWQKYTKGFVFFWWIQRAVVERFLSCMPTNSELPHRSLVFGQLSFKSQYWNLKICIQYFKERRTSHCRRNLNQKNKCTYIDLSDLNIQIIEGTVPLTIERAALIRLSQKGPPLCKTSVGQMKEIVYQEGFKMDIWFPTEVSKPLFPVWS